eukprot:6182378-Pyramimonas_sp.AAC.1
MLCHIRAYQIVLLHFTARPVPITARVLSTPQRPRVVEVGPSGGKHGAVGPGLREGSGRLAAVCVHSLAENGIGHGLRECKGYCVRWDTVCNGILFAMGCCVCRGAALPARLRHQANRERVPAALGCGHHRRARPQADEIEVEAFYRLLQFPHMVSTHVAGGLSSSVTIMPPPCQGDPKADSIIIQCDKHAINIALSGNCAACLLYADLY